jgi:hypothetical protein
MPVPPVRCGGLPRRDRRGCVDWTSIDLNWSELISVHVASGLRAVVLRWTLLIRTNCHRMCMRRRHRQRARRAAPRAGAPGAGTRLAVRLLHARYWSAGKRRRFQRFLLKHQRDMSGALEHTRMHVQLLKAPTALRCAAGFVMRRRWPATCAAAPATAPSWTPSRCPTTAVGPQQRGKFDRTAKLLRARKLIQIYGTRKLLSSVQLRCAFLNDGADSWYWTMRVSHRCLPRLSQGHTPRRR